MHGISEAACHTNERMPTGATSKKGTRQQKASWHRAPGSSPGVEMFAWWAATDNDIRSRYNFGMVIEITIRHHHATIMIIEISMDLEFILSWRWSCISRDRLCSGVETGIESFVE
jgi:hypothetical protein